MKNDKMQLSHYYYLLTIVCLCLVMVNHLVTALVTQG